MFYRIRIDLTFTKEASINAISKTALDHLKSAVIINEGYPNEERGFIQLEQCYHDEHPSGPCLIIGMWQAPLSE